MIVPSYVGTYPKEKYLERRNNIIKMISNVVTETQEFRLTDNYLCSIDLVETNKPGVLFTVVNLYNKNSELVVRTQRNAFECWVCLVDDHPTNGNDYFICGEDHQGYTIFNLTKDKGYSYLSNDISKGNSFVWLEVIPSPSGMSLAVIGSYFQSDIELVFYDFSNPEELPLKEINRHHFVEFDEIEGWIGEEFFSLRSYKLFRANDKKPFDQIPLHERERLLQIPGAFEEVVQIDKYSKSVKEKIVD